jgi:hypothetical protein
VKVDWVGSLSGVVTKPMVSSQKNYIFEQILKEVTNIYEVDSVLKEIN